MQFIDLKQQYAHIKEDVLKEINEVLDSGQYIMGEKITQLESVLATYTGSQHCVSVADGSKALLIALMALVIKAGDEVIVPSFTFIATGSMVALLGATPVFVDVDLNTYNLDADKLLKAITTKTRLIIAVSLYGQCADMQSINAVALKYNLPVIEDAAQSFGATHHGAMSGNLSTIGCTSFFPSKPLGCYGDGGACFTNDAALALKMRQIRVHGQDKRYHHALLGVNGRLDTLQAAILLAKMRIFPQEVTLRKQIGARYSELLSGLPCKTPFIANGNTHMYGQYTLVVENREQLVKMINESGVPTAIHYPIPLHKQPALMPYYTGQDLSNSERLSQQVFSLPMHPYLDEQTQDKIVSVIKGFYK